MKAFRKWLANKIAGLARRIYPQSEEVIAFHTDRMMELIITGNSFIKVTGVPPEEIIIDAAGIHERKSAALMPDTKEKA